MTTALHTLLLGADHKRAPVEYADRVVSGMTRRKLYQEFARRGFTVGVEVGVADGRNALAMCEEIAGLKLYGVDPWTPYRGNPRGGPAEQHKQNYALARERLAMYDVTLVRKHSADAVLEFGAGALDFVYIDGNHQLPYVVHDLVQWAARVKSGGIVAGHDFYDFGTAGVVEAVVSYCDVHGIRDWRICDEREPSFWWVKP